MAKGLFTVVCGIMVMAVCVHSARPNFDQEAYEGPLWQHPELRATPVPIVTATEKVYTHKYEKMDDRTGAYTLLHYTVGVPHDAFLFDSDADGVNDMECYDGRIVLKATGDFVGRIVQDWSPKTTINGGPEWGCLGEDGEPASFFKRVVGAVDITPPEDDVGDFTIEFSTRDIAPWDFFGKSSVRFYSNDTLDGRAEMAERQRRIAEEHATESDVAARKRWGCGSDGYCIKGEAINWNYDKDAAGGLGKTLDPSLKLVDTDGFQLTCEDCHAYAGAGVGFEFETKVCITCLSLKLTYMQLWMDAGLSFSLNTRATADYKFAAKGNIFVNPASGASPRDINIETNDPPVSNKVLKNDIKFSIGPVPVTLNFRVPTVVAWDLSGDIKGEAYAGAYFRLVGKVGIAYLTNDCETSRCKGLKNLNSCKGVNGGFCYILEREYRYGTNGPTYDFQGQAVAKVSINPIIQIDLWGGLVKSFIRLTPFVQVNGLMPCPGLQTTDPSVQIAVTAGASAQIWGQVRIGWDFDFPWPVGEKSFTILQKSTPRYSIFSWNLPKPLFDMCIDFVAIFNKLIPAKAQKTIEKAIGGVLSLVDKAVLSIPPGALESAAQDLVATLNQAPVDEIFTAVQLAGALPVGDVVQLTPHGTQFASALGLELPFNVSAVASCAQVVVQKASNPTDLDWTDLGAPQECDMVKGLVTLAINSFSLYTVSVKPLKAPTVAPNGGSTATGTVAVTLTSPDGAKILATTDGSDPQTATPCDSPCALSITQIGAVTLKTIATQAGQEPSAMTSVIFYNAAAGSVEVPQILPAGGQFVESVLVTLATGTDGASLTYTLNGGASVAYTGPFAVSQPGAVTVGCVATKEGSDPSVQTTVVFTILERVGAVAIAPSGTTFEQSVTLTVSNAKSMSGVVYHYTLDGAPPGEHSQVFPMDSGLVIDTVGPNTIIVVGHKSGYEPSLPARADITITAGAARPVVEPQATNAFIDSVDLIAYCDTEGSTVRYTLDGSDPTESSPALTATTSPPFSVTLNTYGDFVVSMVCFAQYYRPSPIVRATYSIIPQVAPVTLTAPAINTDIQVPFEVTLTTTTASATISYSIAVNDPFVSAKNGATYNAPFQLTQPGCVTVIAVASRDGYANSDPVTETYPLVAAGAPKVATAPVASPPTGNIYPLVPLQLLDCFYNSTVWYTLTVPNGTVVSRMYTAPIMFTELGRYTIEAFSTRWGYADSSTTTAVYDVVPHPKEDTLYVEIVLNVPFDESAHDFILNGTLRGVFASALEIDVSRVSIGDEYAIANGAKTVVVLVILPVNDEQWTMQHKSQTDLNAELVRQFNDPNSVIMQGGPTGSLKGVIESLHVTSTPPSRPGAATPAPKKKKLSTAAIVGIVIGVLAGVALIVVGVIIIKRRRFRHRNSGLASRAGGDDFALAVRANQADDL